MNFCENDQIENVGYSVLDYVQSYELNNMDVSFKGGGNRMGKPKP